MNNDKMGSISEASAYRELTAGGVVIAGGNSERFRTGDWRTKTPIFHEEKCKQCLLCFPVCPDSSIPVKDGKRLEFDYDHCKGCGICASACPFGAITFEK